MQSIWKLSGQKEYLAISQTTKTQVAVVGGGIAGYLTAFSLSQKGFQVILLEANRVLSGVTENTTAFITSLQGVKYVNLEKKYGLPFAKEYFKAEEKAIEQYEKLVNTYHIDCNFTRLPSILFTRRNSKKIIQEYDTLSRMGANVSYLSNIPNLNLKITGAIQLENQAMFHPLKFLLGLPISFTIYEQSRVTKLDSKNKILFVNNVQVKADFVIFCCHFPFFILPKLLPFQMYQSISYCQAYYSTFNLNALLIEDTESGLTLRNYENNIIIGGGDHQTGKNPKQNPFAYLKKEYEHLFSKVQLNREWMAQDCMTYDKVPYIDELKKGSQIYVVTGFNKWGMANAMVSSTLITNAITSRHNEFSCFSFSRHALINSPLVFLNHFFQNGYYLMRGIFGKYQTRVKQDDTNEEDKKSYTVCTKCSHMKCALTYNPLTNTYDCPCHGSKFDVAGNILMEPTIKPLKKR